MKKILTVSLFAIMAVSAANAEIASTRYVTDRTGNTTFSGSVAGSADLTVAVNALATKVDTVAGSGTGSVADQITNALTPVSNQVTANKEAIEAADLAQVGTDGSYIKLVSQENGKMAATAMAFKTAIDDNETSTNAPTSKAVFDHVASQMGVLNTNIGGATTKITALEGRMESAENAIDANKTAADTGIQEAKTAAADALADAKTYADQKDAAQTTAITTAYQTYADQAEAGAIAAAKTETTNQVNALANGAVKTNTESIAAINDGTNGILAQAKSYADQKAGEASGSASEVAGDLAEYIQSNNTAVEAAQAAADKAQGEVDALEGVVTQQNTTLTGAIATAKAEAIEAAKTETTTQVNGLANGAVKTNTDNISTITTNLGGLNGIAIPEACATGRCALVMENNQAKWETINY